MSNLLARYRWHRANPFGAHEVGKAAVIALRLAKAELWANEHEVVVEWVMGNERGEYDAIAYNAERRVVASVGGYAWEDVGLRQAEAGVLAEAMAEW